jgi:hypothetical protein
MVTGRPELLALRPHSASPAQTTPDRALELGEYARDFLSSLLAHGRFQNSWLPALAPICANCLLISPQQRFTWPQGAAYATPVAPQLRARL